MPGGRPPKESFKLRANIPLSLYQNLFLVKPELFQPQLPPQFRHGAISQYITRLIVQDLQASRSDSSQSSFSRADLNG